RTTEATPLSSLNAGTTTLTWVIAVKGSRRVFPWKIAKGRCPPSAPLSLTFGSTFIAMPPNTAYLPARSASKGRNYPCLRCGLASNLPVWSYSTRPRPGVGQTEHLCGGLFPGFLAHFEGPVPGKGQVPRDRQSRQGQPYPVRRKARPRPSE